MRNWIASKTKSEYYLQNEKISIFFSLAQSVSWIEIKSKEKNFLNKVRFSCCDKLQLTRTKIKQGKHSKCVRSTNVMLKIEMRSMQRMNLTWNGLNKMKSTERWNSKEIVRIYHNDASIAIVLSELASEHWTCRAVHIQLLLFFIWTQSTQCTHCTWNVEWLT